MKNYITFFIKKLPILTLIIITGILFRAIGLLDIIVEKPEYHFFDTPVYTAILDSAAKKLGVGNAGSVPVAVNKNNKEKTKSMESEKKEEKKEIPVVKEGYISAEEQAKLSGRSLNKVIAHRKKVSGGTYIYSDTFPKEATRPVVDALDYNVADPTYMDPEGTEYPYPNKGIFKQNNDYYKFQEVDDSYFDKALFIGDSQTDGLYHYGLIRDHASFFALESVTIYNLFDVTIPYRSPQEEVQTNLENVINSHKYRKIYLCVGMNELGDPDTTKFRNTYKEVLKRIRNAQPDAIIYVQGITHVSVWHSKYDPAFNNKNIVQRNHAISTLINGHDIFYLDMNEVLCDGNGDLDVQYTNDGIHMTAHFYPLWRDYLKKYAIIRNKADR